MICDACSADNKDAAKFCFKCGVRLSKAPPSVRVVAPQKCKVCSTCSCSCKQDAKFCPSCGYKFVADLAPSEAASVEIPLNDRERCVAQSDAQVGLPNLAQHALIDPVEMTTHIPPVETVEQPQIALANNSQVSPRQRGNRLAIGGFLVAIIIGGGGIYWYAAHNPGWQTVADAKLVVDNISGATASAPRATPDSAQGLATAVVLPKSRLPTVLSNDTDRNLPAVTPTAMVKETNAPKPRQKNGGRSIDQNVAKTQPESIQGDRVEPAARTSTRIDKSAQQITQAQVAKTCRGTGGLYRLSCEIEGAERYFKCAPDGRIWNHEISGCDRRSTTTER